MAATSLWCARPRGFILHCMSTDQIAALKKKIEDVGPWFHNFEIVPGVWSDTRTYGPGWEYLVDRWSLVESLLPSVSGKACLDVGCCSGFFSFRLKDAGASSVLGVDRGDQPKAIAQARLAEEYMGKGVAFDALSSYEIPTLNRQFDIVLCLGVLYHLRHPLLAIEALRSVCSGTLVLQTITSGPAGEVPELPVDEAADIGLRSATVDDARFPAMKFVEGKLQGDGSCWWIPNPQAVLALLRAGGFKPQRCVARDHEIYVSATAI